MTHRRDMRARLVFLLLFSSLAGCRCGQDRIHAVNEPEDAGCLPLAEVCNGHDDDCDGEVDEDLGTESCGVGACAFEVPSCIGGAVQTCTPRAPSAESCNGLDDDCNGLADDGLLPQGCGVGECQRVVASCEGGQAVSCNPRLGAAAEVCDGLDNDCDGTVDEGLLLNLSSDLRLTRDDASSDYVYAAWNGERFGVVWQDKRDGAAGEIYFVPLDAKGERLRPSDVRITRTSTPTTQPALAWSGESFGLAYSDGASGSTEIYLQRITSDGARLGNAVKVSDAPGNSAWPDIAWTGQRFAVAWADRRGGPEEDLYFRLMNADGSASGPQVQVTTDPARQQSPILKWNGSEFGLTWADFRDGNSQVYFRRLAADGALLGPEVRVTQTSSDASWPDLTWNGTGWALTWQDNRSGSPEIYFARLDAAGNRLGKEVRITDAPGESMNPSIDWNGYQYGLSWQDERGASRPSIYFAQVSADGAKNGPDLKVSTGDGRSEFTTALWNGSTFAFAWRDDRDGNKEIYFAYVGCP